ncbi:MAG: proton-conducting transporter membrane subunit [Bacteriovoracaceae bacterium]
MIQTDYMNGTILSIFLLPLVAVMILGSSLLFKQYWDERFLYRFSRLFLYLALASVFITTYHFLAGGGKAIFVNLEPWFKMQGYEFGVQFQFDYLSMVYCFLVCVLSIVISKFSSTYLLGERGYHRFFLLMLLFNAGNMMIVLAGNIDILLIGWEWVGYTSVLLISFFSNRNFPVKNSMYAFVSYRICDIGLLTAAVLFHKFYHSSSFHHIFEGSSWPNLTVVGEHGVHTGSFLIGLSLIFASLAKSSQFPMSGWLSKAMEGPTPSSAIFYGGISIHLGCFLLLRCSPFIQSSILLSGLLICIGLMTAFYGTMVGRTRADTKTTLAYASMTQVAIIMIEIGLNLDKIALIHIFSHAIIRTFQFLRSASLMQDFLDNPLIYENSVVKTGVQYERIFGNKMQQWLYYFSQDNFYLDTFITRFVVNPVLHLSEKLNRFEDRYCGTKASSEDMEEHIQETKN